MSKEKQIEEIRKDIFAAFGGYAKWEEDWKSLAEAVYNAGYRKQSEPFSCSHEKGCEWISVDERLPENEGIYLAYTTRGHIEIAHFYTYYVSGEPQFDYWITHWMSLPEPPKMKGGAE